MTGNKPLRRLLARAIIIDRATPDDRSWIGRIARARSEENYRFAGRFVAGKSVLDVGGGTGIGHDLLLAGDALCIRSIDRHCAAPARPRDARISAVREDFLASALDDESFDVVICLGTLFYLRDQDAAIAKMHRVLKPGGLLIINCINPRLIRRYFGLSLDEIDAKFSAAHDEAGLKALLMRHFGAPPAMYVQQPVPLPQGVLGLPGFWLTPLGWPWRRHPVAPRPAGSEGMYVYAVMGKGESGTLHAR